MVDIVIPMTDLSTMTLSVLSFPSVSFFKCINPLEMSKIKTYRLERPTLNYILSQRLACYSLR